MIKVIFIMVLLFVSVSFASAGITVNFQDGNNSSGNFTNFVSKIDSNEQTIISNFVIEKANPVLDIDATSGTPLLRFVSPSGIGMISEEAGFLKIAHVSGHIELNGAYVDVQSSNIRNVADGVNAMDAVNVQQLEDSMFVYNQSRIVFRDDFIEGIACSGIHAWAFVRAPTFGSVPNANVLAPGESNHPGICGITSGTNADSVWRLSMKNANVMMLPNNLNSTWIMNVPCSPTVMTAYTIRFGFGDTFTQGAEFNNGIYYDITQPSCDIGETLTPSYEVVTASGGTRTKEDIVVFTNYIDVFAEYRIEITDTREVEFYINDLLVDTLTTNVPSAITTLTPIVQWSRDTGTPNVNIKIDYIDIRAEVNR